MVEHRTIAVMGATGRQGRGIVDALMFTMGDIEYHVRPLTRSLTSKLAQRFERDFPQLSLVQWRVGDISSLEKCFEGCYGVYVDSGILRSPETSLREWTRAELALGEQCRQAVEKAEIKHVIYSSFPSIFDASNGGINIRHFECRHQVSLILKASPIPCHILCAGPFYTDFKEKKYASWDGETVLFATPAQPTKRMGWCDPGHDIGWFTRALLNQGPEYMKDEHIPVSGPSISYEDLASKFSAVTGIKAAYRQCDVGEFGLSEAADSIKEQELTELGKWLVIAPDEKTSYGTMSMDKLKQVQRDMNVEALSWEKFLERTGWRGPEKGPDNGGRKGIGW